MESPSIIFVNGDTAAQFAHQADIAVVQVSRQEIEKGTVGDLVDRLMVFTDDAALAKKFMGRMVLMFDGYNEDPREVTQIPELVAFFVKATDVWPYWLHFLEYDYAHSIQVAINLYIEASPETKAMGGVIMSSYDKRLAVERIQRLFAAMRVLHEQIDLPGRARLARTSEVTNYTSAIFMEEMSGFN